MAHFIVFLDVETTGIDPAKDDIIQLSAIKFSGNQEIDRFNTYINPSRSIPADATSVNKITNEMVVDAPKIGDIQDKFMAFIENAVLVGYNVIFDLNFISIAFNGMLDGMQYLDAMHLAKRHLDLPDYRLETVATYLGFCIEGCFHDSLTDCEATADVFWKLITQELLIKSPVFHAPKQKKKKSFDTFRPKEIVPQAIPTNTNHPLYGKKIAVCYRHRLLKSQHIDFLRVCRRSARNTGSAHEPA